MCNLSRDTLTDGIRQTGRRLLYTELDWFSSEPRFRPPWRKRDKRETARGNEICKHDRPLLPCMPGQKKFATAVTVWMSNVFEPDCYGRPCGDNQVCVPGVLADGNKNGCSYACLNVSRPVCPLPECLNGPQTPGSNNTLSCNAWETRGGTATCGKKWSAVVKKCRPILNLKCHNETVCAPINAECRSERCDCRTGMSYNYTDNLCVPAVSQRPECCQYLVSGPDKVPDAQLSASSVYDNRQDHDTKGARLNSILPHGLHGHRTYISIYRYAHDAFGLIYVQFNGLSHVVGVSLQGRPFNTDPNIAVYECCYHRVTAYKFLYSSACQHFTTVKDTNGSDMIFAGNTDQDTVVTAMLPKKVSALYVRINPVTWEGNIVLRFDILGCKVN
ncbi:neuropilin-1-like [Mya arenaria]|uniref:neuropilin-1-like n=1 Tax=Mya arenaria TaxID=6604 RepID=UPI0022E4BF0A|nr:neuropilin-1-like [Mya arenaria]